MYFYYVRAESEKEGEVKKFIEGSVRDVRDPESRPADREVGYSVTFITMPLLAQGGLDKMSGGKSIWGSYSMPSKSNPMLTAQSHHVYKRQLEEPLEDSSPVSTLQDDDTNPNSTRPLPGVLPACFSTLDSCISTTRNCTGHGTCSLLWTDRDVEEPRTKPCYACSCSPTTITTISPSGDEQTQTVHWGGPACQKRDVSTSFWMIAGITVILVFLISFAVGGLMSVGEETLPSVIGAGVSGVGARGQSTR